VNTAYLGLGSNLGDRTRYLAEAIGRLHSGPGIRVATVSSVYESSPAGLAAQPDFLNLVARVATTREPHELLAECLRIEADLGRVRHERWGPRTIDIDLLLYGDRNINDGKLTVPHPRMGERGFVLVPLAEIAPDLKIEGNSVSVLAAALGEAGLRKLGPLELGRSTFKVPG
jgi:2-amino-4-hydroxy-6-hydroxymethyldihydropteridine diphosphokinase